jgi:hypothetical protein
MDETDEMSDIPQPVLNRLARSLAEDGFGQALPGLFVKHLDDEWRAWIGVDGNPDMLLPKVGVYSEVVRKIGQAAFAKLGRPPHPVDVGPPLILVNIEEIMADDPDCVNHDTWDFTQGSNGLGIKLKPEVADDLAYCIKKKAYPFFETYASYQGIFDAALKGMASFAFKYYFPIVLMKLGRHDYATSYIDAQVKGAKTPNLAQRYRQYGDALLEMNSG